MITVLTVDDARTAAAAVLDPEVPVLTIADLGVLRDVEVRDDGTGFDPQQQSSGFGLIGMRERLALVNGTIEIQSSRGAGTELHARIPTG